jgi:hypothetical protein
MEKTIDQTSLVLVIWQISVIIFTVLAVYFCYSLYKKINIYLDLKIKYLKNKLDTE